MSVNQLKQFGATSGYSIVGGGTPQPEEAVVDPMPQEGSTNPVASGGVYSALATKQDTLTFDNIPTDDSTNPVTSGGVYDALATKQDTLTFDTIPTDDSTNPVTSGGVYDALQNKVGWSEQGILGAKNLLDMSTCTFTDQYTVHSFNNDTGTLIIKATSSSSGYIQTVVEIPYSVIKPYIGEKLVFSILSHSKSYSNVDEYIPIHYYNGTSYVYLDEFTNKNSFEFLVTSDIQGLRLIVRLNQSGSGDINVNDTLTLNGMMLRLASDTDATYQPYAMTNQELTNRVLQMSSLLAQQTPNN